MLGILTSEELSDDRIREVARQSLADKRIWIAAAAEVARHDDEMSPAACVEANVAGLSECALYVWVSLEDVTDDNSGDDCEPATGFANGRNA